MTPQTIDITYVRILPRDLFNEAKLLKCIGRLCLLIHDGMTPVQMSFDDENLEQFEIGLLEDGYLAIRNLTILIKGESFLFKSKYNSQENYPLYVECNDSDYLVFNEKGEWDLEFIELLSQQPITF